jgi:flavin reductase (DIM6/NTAB) family NADH-FMN oxidoreductase RutF
MELDLEGQHASRAYAMLVSLITPRPIAWVRTLDENCTVNAAPFSFFNALGANPPIIGFAPGDRDDGSPKDMARSIRRSHEFVVNLVDETAADAMNRTSASLPYGVSELESAGLTAVASSVVRHRLESVKRPLASNATNGAHSRLVRIESLLGWSGGSMCATL